jgi:D-3-phosphoglycerate dehydrogenase
MRILFADKFVPGHVATLEADGHECIVAPDTSPSDLPAALGDVDVLVVRSTRVTADALDAANRLALVVRAGAGVNTIDHAAAADRGIYVANTPGKNAVAVAELTIGLMTALDRRIPDAVADLRAGRWRKAEYSKANGLAGRRLGIIGMGAIGLAVAARASALEMEVLVEDKPSRAAAAVHDIVALGCTLTDLTTLLSTSDVVSVHAPAKDATRGMVDAPFLAQLKPGAFLINTSRGDLVDETALLHAIEEKGLRVGLDVYADEPGSGIADFTSALAQHPNVYGTHHIGASTEQAQEAIAKEVIAIIDGFARGEIHNCVNLAADGLAPVTIAVRHVNRVGVLVGILSELRAAGLNVQQMTNTIFAGAKAAIATIHVDRELADATVAAVAALDDVLGVSVARE